MDKEKVIIKIIFGVEDLSDLSLPVSEDIKQNFEIVWDIRENFESIKQYLKFRFFKDLKEKAEKELSIKEHGFIISKLESSELYITKPEWRENNNDIGIYAICVQKWDKDYTYKDYFNIAILKNKDFKTSKESEIIRILQSLNYTPYKPYQNYLASLPIKEDYYFKVTNKEFYLERLLSDYDNLLEKTFTYLKKIYEDLIGNKELLNLFEESVKERKKQLNLV